MKILIDNQDGFGSLDYTASVQFGKDAVITRQLNQPTICTLPIVAGMNGLKQPGSGARVQILDSVGNILYTGYVAGAPAQQCAGSATNGAAFVSLIEAAGDEVLLDTEVNVLDTNLLGDSVLQSWTALAALSTSAALPVYLSGQVAVASRTEVKTGARWAQLAGLLADSGRSAYACLNGQIQVVPIGNTAHAVVNDDPGLRLKTTSTSDLRWLATDVTVCGKEEPGAYVTEVFQGDGVTTSFSLSQKPFDPITSQKASITDLFQGTSLNARIWQVNDPAAHISLTGNGLTCAGGSGRDAESTIASLQQIELGGSITIEGDAVQIASGSSGTILGLYTGPVEAANCFAGFQISTSGSEVLVAPMVNGSVSGSSFQPLTGHIYTYRLRVYSPEMERLRQTYFFLDGDSSSSCGGETVVSAGQIEFEVQDVTSGIPGSAVILFSGAVSSLPPSCTLGLMDSGSLACSIKSVVCTQTSPMWVAVGQPGNLPAAQFLAASTAGGACDATTTGTLKFYPANIPAAGTLIYVSYRLRQRAIARRVSPSTRSAENTSSATTWIGSVTTPAPWSSTDCDSAASALLSMAQQSSVTMQGTYNIVVKEGGSDILPGDTLSVVDQAGIPQQGAVIREVIVTLQPGLPAIVSYAVNFANDWVEDLSIKVSSTVPVDAVIPQTATSIQSALLSPGGMTVVNVTASSFTISTGLSAPVNGGFEIRRRDATFGPGTDSDLVLRAATSTITIPRAAAMEQYYVRMYDGANPPNYSLNSAAVFLNVPI